jgi:protein-disulfide isomerase
MRFVTVMLLMGVLTAPLIAQDKSQPSQTKSDEGITREQAAKLIQEMQMIRVLLQKQVDVKTGVTPDEVGIAYPEKRLANLGKNIIGRDNAPLTLVEFVDLECPFCIQFHNDVLPELRRKYIDTGKLKFVVFDFPLPSHEYALPAATFTRCAGAQGKYWQVHNAFMSTPQVATPEVIQKIAIENKLDPKQLDLCLKNTEVAEQINRETQSARELGVFATPTFLLGSSQGDGVTGQMVESFKMLDSEIQKALKHEPHTALNTP